MVQHACTGTWPGRVCQLAGCPRQLVKVMWERESLSKVMWRQANVDSGFGAEVHEDGSSGAGQTPCLSKDDWVVILNFYKFVHWL